MRKFFISILTIAIVFSTTIELLTFSVNATNNNELLKDSFYASKAEQDRLFQATQEETGDILKCLIWEDRTLLKESITPIYTANYMEFAETGKLTVTPGTVTTSNGERQRYLEIGRASCRERV